MSSRLELYKQFGQKQENYTYYIIAMAIAALGFSVHQTNGKAFEKNQILLGLAMLSWSVSVYLGLLFLRLLISTIYANIGLLDMTEGRSDIAGTNPQKIAIGREAIMKIIKSNSTKTMNLHKWQNNLFYLGMCLYIIWHLYGMYLNTVMVQKCI